MDAQEMILTYQESRFCVIFSNLNHSAWLKNSDHWPPKKTSHHEDFKHVQLTFLKTPEVFNQPYIVISCLVVIRQSVGTLYQEKDSKVGISHHLKHQNFIHSPHLAMKWKKQILIPFIYGIFTYMDGWFLWFFVGEYTTHGWYGIDTNRLPTSKTYSYSFCQGCKVSGKNTGRWNQSLQPQHTNVNSALEAALPCQKNLT